MLAVYRIVAAVSLSAIALDAAPQAVVDADEVQVYAGSSAKSRVVGSLKRGQSLTLGLEIAASDGSWCEISSAGPPRIAGYVRCEQLKRKAAPPPNYSVATGAAESSDLDSVIAQALRLSGIEESIAQLGDPSLYLAAMQTKKLTPQQLAILKEIVAETMRPERFLQAVTESVKNSYPAGGYPKLLELLKTPLVRQMSAIELRESRVDRAALEKFVAGLKEAPLSSRRRGISQHIDEVTGSSQLAVDIVAAVMEGIAAGSRSLSTEQSRKMLDDFRAQYGDRLRAAAFTRMLYMYRGVPDDQLSAYATLLGSAPAARFNQAAQRGLLDATRQASAEFMQLLMQRLGVKPPSQ